MKHIFARRPRSKCAVLSKIEEQASCRATGISEMLSAWAGIAKNGVEALHMTLPVESSDGRSGPSPIRFLGRGYLSWQRRLAA
jgi:hypothetical protein